MIWVIIEFFIVYRWLSILFLLQIWTRSNTLKQLQHAVSRAVLAAKRQQTIDKSRFWHAWHFWFQNVIDSSHLMPRNIKFWPTGHTFCPEFESEVSHGFQFPNGELKGYGVWGSEGDNSPFRGARPKVPSYSDFPYSEPYSTHFLVPTAICGGIYRTEKMHREMCGVGFRVRGIRIWS